MSEASQQASAAKETTTESRPSFLEAAIKATKQTERSHAEALLKTFTEQALKGVVTFDKNLTKSITKALEGLDALVSKQLAEVMHHPDFQKLEGSWRGLSYLVMNSETGTQLKLRVLNSKKRDLYKDLADATEFDQSSFYKKVYENEFGTAGGTPYGALIGDFEFTNHPDDIQMLRLVSSVAAASFCPFIASAGSGMFKMDSWSDLMKPRDIAKIFDASVDKNYVAWNSFRETEDSRFVVLTLPRTLARLPYGANTKPIDEFGFEEVPLGADGKPITVEHDDYCWMSTAFVYGTKLTDAFAQTGWCTAIRGAENGGRVDNLPVHVVKAEDGDYEVKCPTEVLITERREKEISDCGFLALSNYKDKDYSVFFGGQTTQKPKKYEGKDGEYATSNAAISARLPYIMATSRIAHYLKVMARDWVGSFMERDDCERRLNNWIANYVTAGSKPSAIEKATTPLAQAKIEVSEVPGAPGSYTAVALLRPWLQFEELTTSMRMVTRIKQGT
jgi:type VI secretion system protein ImpC